MIKEFARAHAILANGLPLETLLEICSQSNQVTKAERRAAERKSHKAKQQIDRQMATQPPTKAEPINQSGPQGDEKQEAVSKSPTSSPTATDEESGTGNQGHLGAKLGLAMSGLVMAGAGESTDLKENDTDQPTGDQSAEAITHEGILQTAVNTRQ